MSAIKIKNKTKKLTKLNAIIKQLNSIFKKVNKTTKVSTIIKQKLTKELITFLMENK